VSLPTHSLITLRGGSLFLYHAGTFLCCHSQRAKNHEEWQIPDPKDMPPGEFRAVRDLIESEVKQLLSRVKSNQ